LIFEKDWTPDKVHKLTVNDIMVISSKSIQDRKGRIRIKSPTFDSSSGGTGPIMSEQEALALKAMTEAATAAEAEAWKGVTSG
jgi:hypothetical protein